MSKLIHLYKFSQTKKKIGSMEFYHVNLRSVLQLNEFFNRNHFNDTYFLLITCMSCIPILFYIRCITYTKKSIMDICYRCTNFVYLILIQIGQIYIQIIHCFPVGMQVERYPGVILTPPDLNLSVMTTGIWR